MTTRILLVESRRLVREGLASLLEREDDLRVVGQTGDGAEGVRLALEHRPTVAVIDLNPDGMNGVDFTQALRSRVPEASVLCLSDTEGAGMVRAALDAGARGFMLRDSSAEELAFAIRALAAHRLYLSPAVAAHAVDSYRGPDATTGAFRQLTPMERRVVQLLAEGHSTKQAAGLLSLSFKTVSTHRQHAMFKLGLQSVAHLTRYALREGLTRL
jgi:DNA-binding NarL/FixJ family response regulator